MDRKESFSRIQHIYICGEEGSIRTCTHDLGNLDGGGPAPCALQQRFPIRFRFSLTIRSATLHQRFLHHRFQSLRHDLHRPIYSTRLPEGSILRGRLEDGMTYIPIFGDLLPTPFRCLLTMRPRIPSHPFSEIHLQYLLIFLFHSSLHTEKGPECRLELTDFTDIRRRPFLINFRDVLCDDVAEV